MKKRYLIAIMPIIIGIGCAIAYASIGSYVATNGTLVEPFFLIPVGAFLILLGIILGIILRVWREILSRFKF